MKVIVAPLGNLKQIGFVSLLTSGRSKLSESALSSA